VSIWGPSEEDLVFEINKDGYIKPDGIPRIYLKGLEFSEVKALLFKRFSNYYNFGKNQFEVALNFSRTINVNITGEVFNYGTFNIPAINTIFNALVAAGGPNDIGSVRKIRHIRPGQLDQIIDIYEYLQDPQYGTQMYLEENDILNIPVADKIVKISGAIIRPHSYELLNNENLVKLLDYCGGLRANASFKNIQITRFENDIEKIIDVDLGSILKSNKDFELKNGDRVFIQKIPEKFKNFMTLNGAVVDPGEYAISDNTKLSEVLSKTQLTDEAYLDVAYLQRSNNDGTFSLIRIPIQEIMESSQSSSDIVVKNQDVLVIYKKSRFIDKEGFQISGSVRNPGKFNYDYSEKTKLSDAIVLAGGLKKYATDFAYLKRTDPDDASKLLYIRVNVRDAINYPSGPENIFIQPGDNLVIYNQEDFIDEFEVTIGGEVRNPGKYKFDSSLTLTDIITMSGGLTFQASRKRIDLYRLKFNSDNDTKTLAANLILDENNNVINGELELQPFDHIIIRQASEFELIKTVTVRGEVKYPGTYALISQNERLTSVIERAGGLTEEAFLEGTHVLRPSFGVGYISMQAEDAVNNPNSSQNIILNGLDEIVIPKTSDLVTIVGNTFANAFYNAGQNIAQINVPYDENKNAKYYIEKYAGGVSKSGDLKKISVQYANGRVESVRHYLWIFPKYPKVEKGCTITVPVKDNLLNVSNSESTDWSDILTNAVGQATAVLTLILLIQRVD
jgi:protein involved in polysaccharide export with SLBB domain